MKTSGALIHWLIFNNIFQAAPPPVQAEQAQSKQPSRVNPVHSTDPALAAMWRQNARDNLFSDSESSDSSEPRDTDTDSSSSSEKQSVHKEASLLQNGRVMSEAKSQNSKSSGAVSSAGVTHSGGENLRSLNGKPPSGTGGNRNNSGSSQIRGFSSLLSRRKQNRNPLTPSLSRKQENSQLENGLVQTFDDTWARSLVRRKPPIDLTLNPQSKSLPSPGAHSVKLRSSFVNKAAPAKASSSRVGRFRAVIDRVRSTKPSNCVHEHKAIPKPPFDARILAFNASNSSSSDDDDDDHDDIDDDSTSDDSR